MVRCFCLLRLAGDEGCVMECGGGGEVNMDVSDERKRTKEGIGNDGNGVVS